jgi:HPt (histidine-containing phosphotransfer) domain-containing protein
MIKLLKNRAKRDRKSATAHNGASVDISRVIPGFSSENDAQAPKPVATKPSAAALQSQPEPAKEPENLEDIALDQDQKYETWLNRDLARMTNDWSALQQDQTDQTRFKQFQLANHNLKGMAATYGYPAISRLATSLDRLLKAGIWQRNEKLVELHIDACRAAANSSPATTDDIDEVSNAVCDALEAKVSNLTATRRVAS